MKSQVWCLIALCVVARVDGAPSIGFDYSLFYPRSSLSGIAIGGLLRDRIPLFAANETLRDAASKRGIFVGAAASDSVLSSGSDPKYGAALGQEYDLNTPENACKFPATEPERNTFTFQACDVILNQTIKTKSAFRGHNFIWGESNPTWLLNGGFDSNALVQILENHIQHVGAKYQQYSLAWDVVNEAVADSGTAMLKNATPWYPAVPDYIDRAFVAARKALGPTVKLFYNDYGGEGMNDKSNKIYELVKGLKSRGIPIDGVGLQMHISVDYYPTFAEVAQNIARLGALGLEVHITEMDVACKPPCGDDRLRIQASIYGGMLKSCLQNSNCKSYETWGFTDKYTWLWDFNNPTHENMAPLPLDVSYQKKPAYEEILATLLEK